MSCGGEEKQWSCAKAGAVNLQKVSSIVRDIGDPCLSQSPIKTNRMLKPDKWQAAFDSEGKVFGFRKVLKLIILGGVDPSIRPEVWEFLLGCYALSSTAEFRRRLRTARRERYKDLVRQCQTMHSSIGTGSLAYIVGSKVMDMRTSSKNEKKMEAKIEREPPSTDSNNELDMCTRRINYCTNAKNEFQIESPNDLDDIVSLRGSVDSKAYDSSGVPPPISANQSNSKVGRGADDSHYDTKNYLDFPPLPVINLFENNEEDRKASMEHCNKLSRERNITFEDERMHCFEINNNIELIVESNGQQPNEASHAVHSEIELASPDADQAKLQSDKPGNRTQIISQLRIADVPETTRLSISISQRRASGEGRVSEWLWTLHRIVVDVVRTDSHLKFYEDTRNLARMSDILAVYAWVDPATGYCQGMSDLLSPFVVLFEDDADAFWCFEMLLRKMRENFQMEGPTGVMKQLEALWHILELTDREMYGHLSHIGAGSLHFAFRMLLVLFRRELSFDEALSMWERMWAADFDETLAYNLGENLLEALEVQLPSDSGDEVKEESADDDGSVKSGTPSNHGENSSKKGELQFNNGNTDQPICGSIKSSSYYPFCGLTKSFWSRNDNMQISTVVSSAGGNKDDELPVFCVAAILILNRHKILRETHSFDEIIKIFNDNILKINVKRCIRTAIKLRKRYIYKVIKKNGNVTQNGDYDGTITTN